VPRALRRTLLNHGQAVQADGCPEQLDWEFIRWIATYRQRTRPKVLALVAEHASDANFLVLSTPRAVREFLAAVP
jgi:hypothetical protein